MKKSFTRVLALALTLMMAFGVAPYFAVSVDAAGEEVTTTTCASGVMNYFKEDTYYDMSKPIDTPLTYEFEMMAMNDIGGSGVRGGVILGNYGKDKTRCVNVELYTSGKIRFYVNNRDGKVAEIVFGRSVRKNSIQHIAITIDVATKSATLYVNGAFSETKTHENLTNLPTAEDFLYNFRIGGDHRSGNGRHFEGAISSVALFSDIRTAEEIAADANKAKTWSANTDGLVAAYDISCQAPRSLQDFSGNGNTLTYTNGSGMKIENYGGYNVEKKLTAAPETIEAWVFLPNYYTTRGGTIFGNNGASSSTPDIAFEIEYDGHPRFFYTTASGTTAIHEFGQVDVRTGSWEHVTIVHDAENAEARCYLNGVLAETLAYTEYKENDNGGKQYPVEPYHPNLNAEYYLLGGDRQKNYIQYFKGFLKEVRVYSDVRTAEEIAADYAGSLDKSDKSLLACYQMSQENAYGDIEDISGNGYTAKYSQILFNYAEPIGDYAYSFAVVGDTQTVTQHNPDKLKNIYQWIINNKDKKNIQYVIGLGDITEKGVDPGHKNYNETTGNAQWTVAKEAITMMDGILPYSLIRGAGHDGVEFFNKYFADHDGYTQNITGYYKNGRVENVYHTFKVGDVNYMILCLDFGAKDDVLEWANEVVAKHHNYRVIVTTHGYMEGDGSLLETGEAYCPSQSYYDKENNDGDDIWNKFVRKHANICMVMCGHMTSNDVVVSKQTGDNGNEVTQILVDPQSIDTSASPKGMVAMLYFSEDGTDVQVEYYSVLTNTWRPKKTFTVSYADTLDHTYDNDFDADCNICGEVREVEIPVTVVAEGTCGVNTTWVLTSDGVMTISGNGDTEDYLVSITEEQPYRAYADKITKVIIEEGVTSIGRGVFYGFTNITEVVLPESLIAIHEYAFFGCSALTSVTIPENTFYIGMYAFRKAGLTEISFANAEGWTFADGTALDVTSVKAFTTEYTYKQTCIRAVTEAGEIIASGVFGAKDQFTWTLSSTGVLTVSGKGDMPKFNVNTTPWYGYRGAIRSVVIEEGITSVGRCSFHTCRAITSVTLPESLETIAEYAFYNCQFLTEATIPANVTRIEIYAFRKCFALKNVEFAINYGWSAGNSKVSATEINSNAADMLTLVNYTKIWTRDVNAEEEVLDPNYVTGGACNTTVKWALTYVDDTKTKMKLTISGTGAMPKFETAGTPWYGYLNDIVEVEVCEGITEIGRCAFYGLKFVKVATIADTVTSINDYAFSGCFSLKTIEIPKSVTYIAETAFTKTGVTL